MFKVMGGGSEGCQPCRQGDGGGGGGVSHVQADGRV